MSLRRTPAALGAAAALVIALTIPQAAAADDHRPEDRGPSAPSEDAPRGPGENNAPDDVDTGPAADRDANENRRDGDAPRGPGENNAPDDVDTGPAAEDDDQTGNDDQTTPPAEENTDEDRTVQPAGEAVGDDGKVWVCKFVGPPGDDERLKDGKNPIHVNANSLRNIEGLDITDLSFGDEWTDAHGDSFLAVGAEDTCAVEDEDDTVVDPGGDDVVEDEDDTDVDAGDDDVIEDEDEDDDGPDGGTVTTPGDDVVTEDEDDTDDVAVLSEVLTRADLTLTAAGDGEVEVLAAVQSRDELPRTGVSALALMVSGLLALGAGTGTVARTRRTS